MLAKKRKINTELFKKVFSIGYFYNSDFFSVKILKLNKQPTKFALVIPKKIIKKATQRNLLRRRFFNIIEEIYKDSPTSYAFIFFLKKEGKELSYKDLKKEIIKVFEKIKI